MGLTSGAGLKVIRNTLSAATLHASGAETTDAAGSDVTNVLFQQASALVFVLDITAQSGTSPTIDLAIQAKYGSFYGNIARFFQKGGVTTKHGLFVKKDVTYTTEETLEVNPAAGTGALNVDGMTWLDIIRCKWDLGGTSPSFTFSLVVYPVI